MSKKILPNKKGFTLIETLIYVSILSLMLTVIVSFALSLNSFRKQTQFMLEINDQGSSAMRLLTQTIRDGRAINAPVVGATAQALSISTSATATNPTVFTESNGTLYITEGSGNMIALTNDKVRFTNFTITNVSHENTPGILEIRFTLGAASTTASQWTEYTADFYGSAAMR